MRVDEDKMERADEEVRDVDGTGTNAAKVDGNTLTGQIERLERLSEAAEKVAAEVQERLGPLSFREPQETEQGAVGSGFGGMSALLERMAMASTSIERSMRRIRECVVEDLQL